MSYHQRNSSNNIQLLRPVESNAQHTSRPSANSLGPAEHGHNSSQMFAPFAVESSRGPEFRYVHQGAYNPSSYRDMQFIGSPQVSQIEIHRSGPIVSVPNSLSVSFRSNTVDTVSSRPRMSLLPHGNEFLQYRTHHLPHLTSGDNITQSSLRIDTRDLNTSVSSGAYHPMVEAISPTGEESNAEDLGNAKNELITHMNKLDSEISETEKTISILKKKQAMLEETASYKLESSNDESSELQPKHRSLAQKIYADNRKKAMAAHAILSSLGASIEYPMYNQPRDAQVCQNIIEKHKSFKDKLIQHLRLKKLENAKDQTETAEKYSLLSQEWNKKVEKIESTLKRKTKEAKNREFFEKVFPELRKQREDKERFNRVGSRIKSEADVEEIIDGLQEQAMEDKKMRSYAVIPPLMLNSERKRCIFKNENGALVDMEAEFKERQNINVWTSGEKETFREKFLQHPKNFGAIAASLDRKTAQDCVRYYYLSKKTENYKQLLRKSRQRTRSSKNPQKSNHNLTPSIIDAMTTGVLTRLQREQQQKTGTRERSSTTIRTDNLCSNTVVTGSNVIAENINISNLDSGCEVVESLSSTKSCSMPSKEEEVLPNYSNINVQETRIRNELFSSKSPKGEIKTTVIGCAADVTRVLSEKSSSNQKDTSIHEDIEMRLCEEGESFQSETTITKNLVDVTGNIKRRRLETETSDSDGLTKDNKTTNPCFICKAEMCLRTKPLEKGKGSLYGINDDLIPAGARVCHTCQSKSIKSRYTTCPLPTCSNPKERIKHFRNIPSKLYELPVESKNLIIAEFQIAPDVNKCCSACLTKLRRKISFYVHGITLSEDQVIQMKSFIKENGPKWIQLSEILGKPANALKSFFQNYKITYGIDSALKEYYDKNPNEMKHLESSDGEESDMSASSSDDREINSDTASAESPGNQNNKESSSSVCVKELLQPDKDNRLIPPLNQPPKRQKTQEEYDSSATETADEENESSPANRQSPKVIHYPFSGMSNGPRSDSNVRDIIGNVIEKAIKEQSIGLPPPAAKSVPFQSESKSEITFVKEYRNEPTKIRNQVKCDSLPTISIVNLPDKTAQIGQSQKNNFISTTITPVNQKGFVSSASIKVDAEPQTLDLSVKKSVREHFAPPGQVNMQGPGLTIYRNDSITPSGPMHSTHSQNISGQNTNYPSFLHDLGRSSKSPSGFQTISVPLSPTTQHNMSTIKSIQQPISQTPPPGKNKLGQKLSPKTSQGQPSNIKGSITHGTPVSSSAVMISSVSSPGSRYDIFRQTPPGDKHGSITQGTPVHLATSQFPEKRMYEYYKSNRQSPAQNISSQSGSPQSGNFTSLYNRPPAFIDHPQLSSKQILLNDYITSQQMIGRGSRSEKETSRGCHNVSTSPAAMFYNEKDRNRPEYVNRTPPADRNIVLSPHRTSPPQRQETPENIRRSHPIKVIQRHNTSMAKPPSPVSSRMHFSQTSFLSGHEAFSSLVDVASKQPFLPVPSLKDEKRPNVPMISIDQSGPINDDIRYQMAREQMALQTAMQRHHLQQHIQMQQQTQQQQQQQHHQSRTHHLTKNKYFSEMDKERRDEDNNRERERVQHQIDREKDRERMHLVDIERNMLIEREFERQRIKADENERSKYARPVDVERPFRPQISSRGDTTFTAANLINAIITHQISQNNTDPPIPREVTRHLQVNPGRELITPPSENNGKRGSPNIINIDIDQSNIQSAGNVAKIKLGDLAESIITKDYSPSPLQSVRPNFSQQYQQELFNEQWKQNKRMSMQKDELQSKSNTAMDELGTTSDDRQPLKLSQSPSPRQRHTFHEPVSPPDSQIFTIDKRISMHPPPSQEFALDCYVKSRIAEAMRTEGDKRIDERDQKVMQDQNNILQEQQGNITGSHSKTEHTICSSAPITSYAPTVYAYPFSALNMVSGGNSLLSPKRESINDSDTSLQSKPLSSGQLTSHSIQEPKPLLSAQYEALSDED